MYSWRSVSPQPVLHYVRDARLLDAALDALTPGPLGFDIEWKPNTKKYAAENPVSLVQLASTDVVVLAQVSAMNGFPQRLKDVLDDPFIVKAGVSINGDCKKLYRDHRVNVRSCVDLSKLALAADRPRWSIKSHETIGLARLVHAYMQLKLDKGKTARSNWELTLSSVQQEYAANDCHAGLAVFQHLSAIAAQMQPPPRLNEYAFDVVVGIQVPPNPLLLEFLGRPAQPPEKPAQPEPDPDCSQI